MTLDTVLTTPETQSVLDLFRDRLLQSVENGQPLGDQIIGKGAEISGPFGKQKLVYADYVASGRAFRAVEDFVIEEVLPFYANTHTEASYCGGTTTRLREQARQKILDHCGGNVAEHAAIFSGSGATSGLNKLVHLFGIRAALAEGRDVHVLVGPYEHHSNILPWRESGAKVTEIEEAKTGGPDLYHLKATLADITPGALIVGSFSAASNVTGICSDVAVVSKIVKEAGGMIVWDYAGGAPYIAMDVNPSGVPVDAIVFSPHKFIGGPGASGVMIVRRDAVVAATPARTGGGTVSFVNRNTHDYLTRIEEREEGGTPNIVGDIRAALVMILKDVIGQDFIDQRNADLANRAVTAWQDNARIRILGGPRRHRLPILSFIVDAGDKGVFDYQLFTRALSDIYGIQARGGCSCAGPYVHRLLGIDDGWSEKLREQILSGDEAGKPGFVRLNLSVLMSDEEVDFILTSVTDLADRYDELEDLYSKVEPIECACSAA